MNAPPAGISLSDQAGVTRPDRVMKIKTAVARCLIINSSRKITTAKSHDPKISV